MRPITCQALDCTALATHCERHYFTQRHGGGMACYYRCDDHRRADLTPADPSTTERIATHELPTQTVGY